MDRNFLKGAHGDAANAILAAAGYSFRRLLAWFAIFWLALITAMLANPADAAIAPFGAAQASLMRPAAANRAYFTVDYIANSNLGNGNLRPETFDRTRRK